MDASEKLKLKFKKYLEENTLNVEGQDGTVYDGLDDDISPFVDSMFASIFKGGFDNHDVLPRSISEIDNISKCNNCKLKTTNE